MPLQKLQFRPGVNREGTTLSNEGGWFDADKVRFRSGFPEKIGGWAALSYTAFLGVCRSLWSWVTNNGYSLVGVGTNLKFYLENGGAYYDITPLREINGNTGSAGPPVVNASVITLATTADSKTLTITDTGATNLLIGDFVTLAGATTLGGLTAEQINGEYQIATISSGTVYTVLLADAATSTASSSAMANLTIAYQINTGSAIYTENTGWGSAPWGGYIAGSTTQATTLNGLLTAVATTSMTVVSTTGFSATNSSILVGNAPSQMVETSLPDDINNSVTTIPVLSTGYYGSGTPSTRSRFSTAGSILIDTEIITYTGLSNDGLSFTGCTRGAFSTTAANHDKGAVVYQNKLENIAYATKTGTTFNTLTRGNESTAGNNAQTYTVTDILNNIITFTSPLVNGTPVRVFTTGTAPTGLKINTTYYVVNSGAPTTATCKLEASIGGGAIDITGVGTGAQTIITLGTTFATDTDVYDAAAFPGWGEGFTSTLGLQLRLWSQTNFGEYLLFAERGGPPYVWDPETAGTPAFTERGTLISAESGAHEVPTNVYQIMVSSSSRITLAFGATSYSYDSPALTFDPMLIRWTNVESFKDWDPLTVTGSQAGSLRLSHGSEIIGAMQTRQEILVWTDSAMFSLQYIGYPFVWKNELLADNISIMGPNAMSTASGVSFWMGTDKFYVYSGRVETLPCSLRQYVFEDINTQQSDQIFSGSNEGYSEVWWFYCSITGPNGAGTADNPNTTIDRYIIFNYLDRVWYYGTLNRTAWIDSGLRPYPLAAAGGTNLLVYHEAAVDNGETNPPTAITSYVQSSDFDIGDGHNYGFVWRVIPDITFNGSQTTINQNPTVDFIVRPRYNPGAAYGIASAPAVASAQNYATQSTYNVQEFTQEVFTRIRGRQMAFRVECDTLGTQWQLGVPRIDIRPDGRR